jgi:hypothetical protein
MNQLHLTPLRLTPVLAVLFAALITGAVVAVWMLTAKHGGATHLGAIYGDTRVRPAWLYNG